MSTPSEQQTPAAGAGPSPSSTQEIPIPAPVSGTPTTVQQLPPPSAPVRPPAQTGPATAPAGATAVQPGPAPAGAAQPTGPVDFVPGLPGLGGPTAPPAAAEEAPAEQPRAPRDRAPLVGAGLVALALVLLQLGLSLRFGTASAWSAIPLWSAFATACTVLGLAAFAGALGLGRRLGARTGWRIAAGGLTGLAVFWVLVVLPGAGTDRGFLLTAALGALGGALWLATGRGGRAAEDGAPSRG
ncbi:hypothetical protein E9549_20740 [Blastococcus sp. MG754426]|uniref:hypothetical protein n=1 Tax=unclassified Blastococcus TaxID=2619396 RepID=UPI001EF08023|nr:MULTISPECIES: hypothetical protein [unclassified Blastococcus]MCF6509800.1 hypothetical protein [Blastococcus sp. MG754426]MCF6514175.1 hypothetical protein [Blastococcus sp. MG754427]